MSQHGEPNPCLRCAEVTSGDCGAHGPVFTTYATTPRPLTDAERTELLDFVDRFCQSATEWTPKELHQEAQGLLRKHGRSMT